MTTHHLDHEPFTGDSWCVECQVVYGTRAQAEAHTDEPTEWIDVSCGACVPCRHTYATITAPTSGAHESDGGGL